MYRSPASKKVLEEQQAKNEIDDKKKREPCIKCCPCWVSFSDKMKVVVESNFMTYFVVGLILANSALMASEMHDQADWLGEFQYWGNVLFTILFTVEMVINMIGLGCKDYFKDGFNVFDFIVVILSLIELGA